MKRRVTMVKRNIITYRVGDTLPVLLTLEEVAKMFNKSHETVRKMAVSGEIPAVKIENVWRVDTEQLCDKFAIRRKHRYWTQMPQFMALDEFAEFYKISEEAARQWACAGKIPAAKFKGGWQIDAEALREMFNRSEAA